MSQQQQQQPPPLFFSFRGRPVPVTWSAAVSYQEATMTLESKPFQTWVKRIEGSVSSSQNDNTCSRRQINIESVELQSVDLFGARGVGFAKLKSHCTLEIMSRNHHNSGEGSSPPSKQAKTTTTSSTTTTTTLPGICLLRGDAVAILVALFCSDADDNDNDNDTTNNHEVYTLLVEQPRIPIGQVDCLELPAGMMDDDGQTIQGTAVKEMQEECGIEISPGELIDLTKLAFQPSPLDNNNNYYNSINDISNLPQALGGVPPSQGGCDEVMRLLYLEKSVTQRQLQQMQNRLTGLRSEGEVITLRVVPYQDAWRLSADGKAIIARFLAEQLRQQGKIPAFGKLATPLGEPTLSLNINNISTSTMTIPQLAFGCYKVPENEHGESILKHAIQAGYRHFDTASFYGNEATLGRVLRQSGIPREKFFLVSKVWNDAQKQGRAVVRESVLQSINALDFGGYWDLFLVHWPVPNHYIDTYHELETLQQEGKIRAIGLSNFSIDEYNALIKDGITVPPVLNQFEVSPFMYRPKDVAFFQTQANMVVAASKAMHRAGAMDNAAVQSIAQTHNVTPAQVMIRWSLQKNLVVLSMSSSLLHQRQNRDVMHFCLSPEEMDKLDSLTSEEAIKARAELEVERKKSM